MVKENLKYPSRTKGIISVALALFMPVVSIALGIAAIVNSRRTLATNPTSADAKSGYVLGLVGTSINLVLILIYFSLTIMEPTGKSEYVNYRNFEQIEIGVKVKDVEKILGEGLFNINRDFFLMNVLKRGMEIILSLLLYI